MLTNIQEVIAKSKEITGLCFIDRNELLKQLRVKYPTIKMPYTDTDVTVKEDKSPVKKSSFAVPKGFEKQYKIFEMFVIRKPENPVIVGESYESIKKFFDRIFQNESIKQLEDFMTKYSKSFDFIERFSKKFIAFKNGVYKSRENILKPINNNSNNRIQSLPSRDAVEKVMKDFKSYIMNGILEPSVSRLSDDNEPKENVAVISELIEKLNKYISAIGIYTYSDAYPGKEMSDDDYDYYEHIDTLHSSNADLEDVIKQIHYLPYILEYEDRRHTEPCYNSGSIVVYTLY